MTFSRRDFLGTSLAAGAAIAAPKVHASTKADKRYKTALIGCGWWGTNIGREAVASGAVELVGMCDVDDLQLAKSLADISRKTTDQPKKYRDFRELIAKEKPEIVIVATPDHWHPLITIAAVKAGAARLRREADRPHDRRRAARWSRPRARTAGSCRSARIGGSRRTTSRG